MAPISPDGSTPREIDAFLESLRNHPLLQRDFPLVELADIKRYQAYTARPWPTSRRLPTKAAKAAADPGDGARGGPRRETTNEPTDNPPEADLRAGSSIGCTTRCNCGSASPRRSC